MECKCTSFIFLKSPADNTLWTRHTHTRIFPSRFGSLNFLSATGFGPLTMDTGVIAGSQSGGGGRGGPRPLRADRRGRGLVGQQRADAGRARVREGANAARIGWIFDLDIWAIWCTAVEFIHLCNLPLFRQTLKPLAPFPAIHSRRIL